MEAGSSSTNVVSPTSTLPASGASILVTPLAELIASPGGTEEWVKNVAVEFKPTIGRTFDTLEAGILFYNVYAVACGFDTRLATTNRAGDKTIVRKNVLCNRAGFKEVRESQGKKGGKSGIVKRRRITRIGCEAMISFKYIDGKYVVDRFHEGHNHRFFSGRSKQFQKLNRELNLYHERTIINNSKVKVGPSMSYKLVKENMKGYRNIGATRQDFKNYYRDVKLFIGDRDAQMFIDSLNKIQQRHKGFYYDYEVDSDGSLARVFWADPLCKKNYKLFGDAVSYDPTYDTNKYCMVFTPFTGVDHHGSCVTFGSALLAHEDEKSFVWVFKKFLEAMDGCEPQVLITDQCPAMKKAVPKVFEKTTHRYCMWHIMKKMDEKVGHDICHNTNFLKQINGCAWDMDLEPLEFEAEWLKIIAEFQLGDNQWLEEIFGLREQWIPAYFRGLFMAGLLRTTQRSESENSFFKIFEDHFGTLVEFWMRFLSAMDQQRHNQDILEAASLTSLPQLSTPIAMEAHAADVYTHSKFYEFQEQLKLGISGCGVAGFTIADGVEITSVNDLRLGKPFNVSYVVETQEAVCSCKLFHRKGMPCSHMLYVFGGKGLKKIPDRYIVDRWSKDVLKKSVYDLDGNLLEDCEQMEKEQKALADLWSEVYNTIAAVEDDEESSLKLIEALKEFRSNLVSTSGVSERRMSKRKRMASLIGTSSPTGEVEIKIPKQSKNKGSGKRMRSDKEKAVQAARKNPRLCRTCDKIAYHDSRNCDGVGAEDE